MRLKGTLPAVAVITISSLVAPVVHPAGGARMPSTVISPGNLTSFHVSPTACWVRLQLVGGSGQSAVTTSNGATGGAGGLVSGYLAVGQNQYVQGGDSLKIRAGFGGANGGFGAAAGGTGGEIGGGATAVWKAGTLLAVAGGGGATGKSYPQVASGGQGGAGGIVGTPQDNGGVGGSGSAGVFGGLSPATGGTASAPGAGASFTTSSANAEGSPGGAGILGDGGAGGGPIGPFNDEGGGGGAGYYSGGGGAAGSEDFGDGSGRILESAGGGGSSFLIAGSLVDATSTPSPPVTGDGQATLSSIGCQSQTLTVSRTMKDSIRSGTSRTLSVETTATEPQSESFTSLTPTHCTISGGNQLAALLPGKCKVKAFASGSDSFQMKTKAFSMTVIARATKIWHCRVSDHCAIPWIKGTLPLYSLEVESLNYSAGPPAPVFSSASDGLFSVSSKSPSVCTVTGLRIKFQGLGTCKLNVAQGAGTIYAAAPSVVVPFMVTGFFEPISVPNTMTQGERVTTQFALDGCRNLDELYSQTCSWRLPRSAVSPIANSTSISLSFLGQPVSATLNSTTFSATFTVPSNSRTGSYVDRFPALFTSPDATLMHFVARSSGLSYSILPAP